MPQAEAVEALINGGVIEVLKTEDGKYTNIAAINVYEPVTGEMIKALSEKTGLDLSGLAGSKNAGELYQGLNRLINGQSGEAQDEKAQIESEDSYIVKEGDALWRIAKQFGIDWHKIADYNQLKNPHVIFPGQKLHIMQK